MLQTGDWLRPRYAGGLWFDKPPLAMWMTALFYKLFGVSEFSARLFSALCGAGTVWAVYRLGRMLWGSWAGFCGAAMLVSAGFFLTTARFATLDSPLVFFLTLAFFFFWKGRERPAWLWAAGAAFGLAILTKGFAAVLYALVLALYSAWAGEWRPWGKKEFWGGLALAVAIALPWHLFEWLSFREAFWRDVVVKHLFSRTTQAVEGHAGGWTFYFRVLLNKFRPAIFIGVAAIPWFLWSAARRRDKAFVLVSSWIVAGFLLASAVRTKLNWYVYPILPPLSLAVGFALARMVKPKFFPVVALAAALAIGSHGFKSRRFFQDYSEPIKRFAEIVRRDVPPEAFVHLVRYHEDPAATFYWQRRVADVDEEPGLRAALAQKPFFALIRAGDYRAWKPFFDAAGAEIRKESGGFYWVAAVV